MINILQSKKSKAMKILGIIFSIIITWQFALLSHGQAKESNKNIPPTNLIKYQQQPNLLKILITPNDNPPYELGIATLQESTTPNKLTYYRGAWIINKNTQQISYPIVIQHFVVIPKETQGVVLNKQGQMPYLQNLALVQTNSTKIIPIANPDTSLIVQLPEEKIIHTPAGDFPTIMIKTYNPATQEGLIQYLAKDLGVIRLEAFNNQQNLIIAELKAYRPLSVDEINIIKKTMPKELKNS